MAMASDYDSIVRAFAGSGLIVRGGFHVAPGEEAPAAPGGAAAQTIVLIGNAGSNFWRAFAPQLEGGPDPLEHWIVATVGPIAERLGARAVYAHERPYWPFQRWAMRAEPVAPSPLGLLIHEEYGLWHAYRAALVFAERLSVPDGRRAGLESPCERCSLRPCLSACPVGAFSDRGYDLAACAAHLGSPDGMQCLEGGCAARLACPVGRAYRYSAPQMRFHMAAFARSHVRREHGACARTANGGE